MGSEAQSRHSLDMVTVARAYTATQASLLKNVLEAADIPAAVQDAHLVQAYSWLTQAVGGVRIQVPSAFVEAARKTLAEFDAGSFALADDADDPAAPENPVPAPPRVPLWSPDAAAFWSLLLTPLFGTTLHYLNARALADDAARRQALRWLIAAALATVVALFLLLASRPQVLSALHAGTFLLPFTALWYLMAGLRQGKSVIAAFGSRYPRKPLFGAWLGALAALVLLGLVAQWMGH